MPNLGILTKPIEELGPDDINELITVAAEENDSLEFKRELSSKSGRDSWYEGVDTVGDKARNNVLKEVIAFANAYGGTLVVGIQETDSKPSRAEKVEPIPRCIELADRLTRMAGSCVDPRLPIVHVRGVTMDSDGNGVVVLRVPQSRLRPHRLTPTSKSHFRSGEEAREMTMREVQELTLQAHHSFDDINRRFEKLARDADAHARIFAGVNQGQHVRIQVAALPVGSDLYIERVHDNDDVEPVYRTNLRAKFGGRAEVRIVMPDNHLAPTPILRGTQYGYRAPTFLVVEEVYDDGSMLFEIVDADAPLKGEPTIIGNWVVGLFACAALTAERFRIAAGGPDVEYGLEVQLGHTFDDAPAVSYPGLDLDILPLGFLHDAPVKLPRYSLGSFAELDRLATMLVRDLCDCVGSKLGSGMSVGLKLT